MSVYGCTIPIYLHALTEAAAGAMLAVGRVVGVAAVQLAVLADGAALVVRVSHIQSLYNVDICSRWLEGRARGCPILAIRADG